MNQMYEGADHWALNLVTEPEEEPITLEQAKAHLRVDFADDDDYINALITVAREITEQRTNRALITQTWEYILDDFPRGDDIKLRKPSLQSVTSVNYTDSSGIEHIMPTTDYVVDKNSKPGRIFLGFAKIWPVAILQPAAAVRIRFVAGYGAASDVPQALKQAMFFLISQFYEQREPVYLTSRLSLVTVPMTFDYLIGPYKVVRLQ
jgi:uncharacterized phiE125 gp8 family phage protein